ncbi:MAG: glycosyltransferase family 2 protein [Marinagarivorans sp.]|nr:glycosyltransferase family 2 protein [Marinagarivorans sp.]
MLTGLFTVLVLLLLAPSFFFVVQVIVGVYRKPFILDVEDINPSCAIIIPAHNEAQVIEKTLTQLMLSVSDNDRVIVVADNCSDDTAALASQFNCIVLERIDLNNRGKGFALAHGLASLSDNPPDVVVFVDADCDADVGVIARLKKEAMLLMAPVQATYLLTAPIEPTAKTRVSAFAIYIKNYIRPMGLSRLGGSVPITGSGFAVPYAFLASVQLASGEIVEDMKLGIDLLLAGHKTCFSPSLCISSVLPVGDVVANVQRERWEHGHLSMVFKYAPPLFVQGFSQGSGTVLLTALDMCILPLTLLVTVNFCLFVVCFVLGLLGMGFLLAKLAAVALVAIFIALTLANLLAAKAYLRMSDIFGLVNFALSKVAVYRAVLMGKKTGWVKTHRDD